MDDTADLQVAPSTAQSHCYYGSIQSVDTSFSHESRTILTLTNS
jgi:hypothetical protein